LSEKEDYFYKKDLLRTIITKSAFYQFTFAFDYYFLFPFNWYFGLAECVWTAQEQFATDLLTYFSLAKSLSSKPVFYSRKSRDFNAFCNTFFRPCTCFKFPEGLSQVIDKG
jgi:hypothetical protein